MPMPSNSSGISGRCASCAGGWAGSSAISAARLKVRLCSRMPSPSRSAGPPRSARSSSASAARSFIPSTLRRSSASARAKAAALTSSVSKPLPAPYSCCTPGRYQITRTTVTPCGRHRPHRDTHRLCDRAGLCRQGIPRPRRAKSSSRLHLRPEARRLRCHRARAAPPLGH